jgi:hypothetical protein
MFRPYPSRERALRQLDRHEDEWAPGGPFPLPLQLPDGWESPLMPETVRMTAEQAEALRKFPERLRRNAEAAKVGAAVAFIGMARRVAATHRVAATQHPPVDEYRLSTRPGGVGGGQ